MGVVVVAVAVESAELQQGGDCNGAGCEKSAADLRRVADMVWGDRN